MTKTTDIAIVLEVGSIIENATDGAYSAKDATGVMVRDVSRSDSMDGFAYWTVVVRVYEYGYVVRRFAHNGKAAAQSYAWDVADALGLEVS